MGRPRAFDHDRALEMWQRGINHSQIARRVSANPGTLRQMIRRMRERGDDRAVRRYLGTGFKKYPRTSNVKEISADAFLKQRNHLIAVIRRATALLHSNRATKADVRATLAAGIEKVRGA